MPKFRKKPVVISAFRTSVFRVIDTLEGPLRAKRGDWIITGVAGERYPCDDEIFRATYEPIGAKAEAALRSCGFKQEVNDADAG